MSNMWPKTRRADTLGINLHYLRRRVGEYMGYRTSPEGWSQEQIERVDHVIDEGCRQYYYPPVLPPPYAEGAKDVHEWSFMRPVYELETQANQRVYPLPTDWEHPIGNLTFNDTDNDYYAPIQFTNQARLRSLEYQTDFVSYPQFAAVRPVVTQGMAPQTLELILHPVPDKAYQLSVEYQAHARKLTDDNPWPLGGQIHGAGILASCMAAAELYVAKKQGPLYKQFLSTLAGNIARDYERGAAILGYNSDGWDYKKSRGLLREYGALYYNDITYDGGTYSG